MTIVFGANLIPSEFAVDPIGKPPAADGRSTQRRGDGRVEGHLPVRVGVQDRLPAKVDEVADGVEMSGLPGRQEGAGESVGAGENHRRAAARSDPSDRRDAADSLSSQGRFGRWRRRGG